MAAPQSPLIIFYLDYALLSRFFFLKLQDCQAWLTDKSLTKLDTGKDGDYKQTQLNVVCGEEEYNAQVVSKFREICPHKKAIAFCAGVPKVYLLVIEVQH